MKRILISLLLASGMALALAACGGQTPPTSSEQDNTPAADTSSASTPTTEPMDLPEDFVLIAGGTFQMGSPEDEAWRSDDETLHTVTVSGFYMSACEVSQAEYAAVMGENPSSFSGDDLPVEHVSWLDAAAYSNARSQADGLTPVYTIDGQTVSLDRSANGYRLPTEAEWEYACRAGTTTPFYLAASPSAEEANYYGHYPYLI